MEEIGDFHDGFFDGLLIDGSSVHVFVSTENKQPFVLRIDGVRSLKADGIRQGNIIFDVLMRAGEEITYSDMIEFYGFKDETQAQTKLDQSKIEKLVVIEINPSYGATCSILASSANLVNRPEWMHNFCVPSY